MDWKEQERQGRLRKELKNKLALLGKRVRRKGRSSWEEGTIVIDSFDGKELEYFIKYKEDDMEQLIGLPFEIWDEEKNKFVEDNDDIKVFFNLSDEEREFYNTNFIKENK